MRFGVAGEREYTLGEIVHEFDATRERIRQISLARGRVARVIFCVEPGAHDGFIKKTQKTPQRDIALALRRRRSP